MGLSRMEGDGPLENAQTSGRAVKFLWTDDGPIWRMEGDGPLENTQSSVASGKIFVDTAFRIFIQILLDIEFEFNLVTLGLLACVEKILGWGGPMVVAQQTLIVFLTFTWPTFFGDMKSSNHGDE
ncbi:hypothetical protein RHSIM_Rhsim05G0020200 [Rhododendron simsii]|uniref:Uncharacterized protein n=1 Tax=Rhododendron simsii TaxID=118357 RepID=A0A834LME2_RHOSS|nr:hypothetical protein RHSIM_Rhsim05G0020200 [Rhododendron simsii]